MVPDDKKSDILAMLERLVEEDGFSYYHFVQTRETTLGEYWEDNPGSHNHDMMGSLMELYYSSIAGIKVLAPGFSKIAIKPYLPEDIRAAKCSYESIHKKNND